MKGVHRCVIQRDIVKQSSPRQRSADFCLQASNLRDDPALPRFFWFVNFTKLPDIPPSGASVPVLFCSTKIAAAILPLHQPRCRIHPVPTLGSFSERRLATLARGNPLARCHQPGAAPRFALRDFDRAGIDHRLGNLPHAAKHRGCSASAGIDDCRVGGERAAHACRRAHQR